MMKIPTIIFGLVGLSNCVFAETITLDAIQTGYYYTGSYTSGAFVTGVLTPWIDDTRGFMAFDLTMIPIGAIISSATFQIENPNSFNEVGPGDPLRLNILRTTAIDGTNYWNGNNYGFIQTLFSPIQATKDFLPSDNGTTVSIDLSNPGIAAMNADLTNSFYSFGMKIVKADVDTPKPIQYVFGDTFAGQTAHLVVSYSSPVPEPASFSVIGLGLIGLITKRRIANKLRSSISIFKK